MIRNFALRVFFILLLIGGFAALAGYWYYERAISKQLNFPNTPFQIETGDTINGIAKRLVDQGVTTEPWTLRILARHQGVERLIKAGEYDLPNEMTLVDFLDRIIHGRGQIDLHIVIVEGWTFKQMRSALNSASRLNHKTAAWTDAQLMAALGDPELHPEGQFYPDTYYYRANDSDLTLYRKSFQLMQRKLTEAWAQRDQSITLNTPYEALILASIIEKETQVREEQPTIAGVFYNRLKKGMRLQTDPTVIYGVGDAYNGDITRKHLNTDTPYNTYTRHGLTPTPISLPGEDSLMATVKPAKTSAYYFVAKGGGRHYFSKTLKEHNNAVKKYLLNN